MCTDDLVTLVDKVFVTLYEALQHVEDELLVVVDENSEDSSHREEDPVPLEVAHLDLRDLVGWNCDLEQSEQRRKVLLGSYLQDESQSVDYFISELVALLGIPLALRLLPILYLSWQVRLVLHDEAEELDDVCFDALVQANRNQNVLQQPVFLLICRSVLQLAERHSKVVLQQLFVDQVDDSALLGLQDLLVLQVLIKLGGESQDYLVVMQVSWVWQDGALPVRIFVGFFSTDGVHEQASLPLKESIYLISWMSSVSCLVSWWPTMSTSSIKRVACLTSSDVECFSPQC